MLAFTCPANGATVPIGDKGIVSTHRTSRGRLGYVRCACGGLVVVEAHRGAAWRATGHGAGSRAVPASTLVPAAPCA